MSEWNLEDFDVGNFSCQIIRFSIKDRKYIMVFNRVDLIRDQELINKKAQELGIEYLENSYEIKFGLEENFNNDTFFETPEINLSASGMQELGEITKDLFDFHHRSSNAEAYIFISENKKLKRFYDDLRINIPSSFNMHYLII